MQVRKAVITAASPRQRTLALQTLVDPWGVPRSVLEIIVGEALRAGMEQVCVVVGPGEEPAYAEAVKECGADICFVTQPQPLGYANAVAAAYDFVGGEPFLHMVGDHVYVSSKGSCALDLVEVARQEECAVSGVQPTRENLLPYFGAIGGRRVPGRQDLFVVERVSEKPTPTEAEQSLLIPGLRAGHYLCFFGIHVLTPAVMEILAAAPPEKQTYLSPVLDELARRERYLALESRGRRYAVDRKYGLLAAQLALGLSGPERQEVLALLCELLAQEGLSRLPDAGKLE